MKYFYIILVIVVSVLLATGIYALLLNTEYQSLTTGADTIIFTASGMKIQEILSSIY